MSRSEQASFIFVVCQVGAEAALKKELAREHPEFRFAFSRPGFVTFKVDRPLAADFVLRSVFARAYGLSFGKLGTGDGGVKARAKRVRELLADGGTLVHVWRRDLFKPGEEPPGAEDPERETPREAAIRAIREEITESPVVRINEPAAKGELVVDVILVEEDEWWFGLHRHAEGHSPFPGGNPEVTLPVEAPSRAYLKLEEAVLWSGAPLKAGDTAVEIGSAPGGAVHALLQRGLSVVGIDPGKMDPRVLASPRFRHLEKSVVAVRREELPSRVEWLLLDMNVKPAVSLAAVERLALELKESLLGVLLTVKLNDWKFAGQIPQFLKRLRLLGFERVKATQLPNNRQEIFLFGLTRSGVLRLASSD